MVTTVQPEAKKVICVRTTDRKIANQTYLNVFLSYEKRVHVIGPLSLLTVF